MDWTLRALLPGDLPGLAAVQIACYGEGLVESTAVFARRLASPANASLVITRAGQVCAYLAAYRSCYGKVTPLHGDFMPSTTPDTLYLHDMAVHPACAGQGLAQRLVSTAWSQAPELTHTALVSVQDSQAYWQRYGYAVQTLAHPIERRHLASYGDGAVYMARALPSG